MFGEAIGLGTDQRAGPAQLREARATRFGPVLPAANLDDSRSRPTTPARNMRHVGEALDELIG